MNCHILLIFLLLSCCFARPAWAEVFISELRPLDFGTLAVAPGGTRSLTVSPEGGFHGSAEVVAGNPSPGEYLITSQQESLIAIEVTSIAGPSVQLGGFTGTYAGRSVHFPAWGLPSPSVNGETLLLGAKLDFTSAVIEGHYQPGFDITISYE